MLLPFIIKQRRNGRMGRKRKIARGPFKIMIFTP